MYHNLCFEQKFEKEDQNFHLKNLFLVVNFSIYLNRRVFVMKPLLKTGATLIESICPKCFHFKVGSFSEGMPKQF